MNYKNYEGKKVKAIFASGVCVCRVNGELKHIDEKSVTFTSPYVLETARPNTFQQVYNDITEATFERKGLMAILLKK